MPAPAILPSHHILRYSQLAVTLEPEDTRDGDPEVALFYVLGHEAGEPFVDEFFYADEHGNRLPDALERALADCDMTSSPLRGWHERNLENAVEAGL